MKDHYLNCLERYEDMIDHHSYIHSLSSSDTVVMFTATQTLYINAMVNHVFIRYNVEDPNY